MFLVCRYCTMGVKRKAGRPGDDPISAAIRGRQTQTAYLGKFDDKKEPVHPMAGSAGASC